VAVKFQMKSRFFHVSEWLDSEQRPELRMGPAILRLVTRAGGAAADKTAQKIPTHAAKPESGKAGKSGTSRTSGPSLRILSVRDQSLMKSVSLAELRKGPLNIGPVRVVLVQAFERAAVGAKKLEESGGQPNPALELKVEHQGKALREIAFARFPTFALNAGGAFGLKFEYVTSGAGALADSASASSAEAEAPRPAAGNVIEFQVARDDSGKSLSVELFKNGSSVLKKQVQEGEAVETPWMGMVLTLDSVVRGGEETEEVKAIDLPARTQLPPSAIFFRVPGAEVSPANSFWMVEGSSRSLPLEVGGQELYYGMNSVQLPFSIKLNKFSKIDYPGTETAMSYQSEVQVNGQGDPITIKMNEPLKKDGFTLYQSSYILQPGQPAVSIFSVNQDPGRWVKYFGSIALCLGIVIFTVMRSSWYLQRQRKSA
jgi:hypothetical protein